MIKISAFRKRVYSLSKKIPQGKVTTYKAIAQALNCKAYQAVGQALRRNPYAPLIPCHRVVASDGTIGSFGGEKQGKKIQQKIKILKKEGIKFKGKRILRFKQIFFKFT